MNIISSSYYLLSLKSFKVTERDITREENASRTEKSNKETKGRLASKGGMARACSLEPRLNDEVAVIWESLQIYVANDRGVTNKTFQKYFISVSII